MASIAVFIVAFVVTGLVAITLALAAASVQSEPAAFVFERKSECVYDGCFCRGERGLVQTACPPAEGRACLPIADRCGE